MGDTLEQLKERSEQAKAKRRENWEAAQHKDASRWNYTYLDKGRKEFIDSLTVDGLITLLDKREYVIVGWAIGVIADKWLKGGHDSEIHENPHYLSNKTSK